MAEPEDVLYDLDDTSHLTTSLPASPTSSQIQQSAVSAQRQQHQIEMELILESKSPHIDQFFLQYHNAFEARHSSPEHHDAFQKLEKRRLDFIKSLAQGGGPDLLQQEQQNQSEQQQYYNYEQYNLAMGRTDVFGHVLIIVEMLSLWTFDPTQGFHKGSRLQPDQVESVRDAQSQMYNKEMGFYSEVSDWLVDLTRTTTFSYPLLDRDGYLVDLGYIIEVCRAVILFKFRQSSRKRKDAKDLRGRNNNLNKFDKFEQEYQRWAGLRIVFDMVYPVDAVTVDVWATQPISEPYQAIPVGSKITFLKEHHETGSSPIVTNLVPIARQVIEPLAFTRLVSRVWKSLSLWSSDPTSHLYYGAPLPAKTVMYFKESLKFMSNNFDLLFELYRCMRQLCPVTAQLLPPFKDRNGLVIDPTYIVEAFRCVVKIEAQKIKEQFLEVKSQRYIRDERSEREKRLYLENKRFENLVMVFEMAYPSHLSCHESQLGPVAQLPPGKKLSITKGGDGEIQVQLVPLL